MVQRVKVEKHLSFDKVKKTAAVMVSTNNTAT